MNAPTRPMATPGAPEPQSAVAGADAQRAAHAGAAASTSAGAPPAPDAAAVQSLISAVMDVLPGYGDGFVEACLQASGWDTATTINALLTGDLPADVARLDRNAVSNPLRKRGTAAASSSAAASGASADAQAAGALSWGQTHGVDLRADSRAAAAAALQRQPPKAKSSKCAGQKASRLFDVSKYEGRDAIRDKALEVMMWDTGADAYDDEYDDSFDDLAPGTRDGETDAETTRTSGARTESA
jgi:activating signal cointegrator complex subunit 2